MPPRPQPIPWYRGRSAWGVVLAAFACSETVTDPEPGTATDTIGLLAVATGLSAPVYLTALPGDDRLFVVEQGGRIRIVRDGQVLTTPFLDLSGTVSAGGEQGLLSMAFHPAYAANGRVFVSYTDRNGTSQIERYQVSGDPDRLDPASATTILSVPQPFPNHNGGLIGFGPDGFLYIGLGDGGSGGDPLGHGQNAGTLLGSLLRIDVDGALPYTVPPDNPFVGDPTRRDEIWAVGLRNPWRWAFDGGLLYIADVGQDAWEEVNVVSASAPGLNYGWAVAEGDHCFGAATCDRSAFVAPAVEYDHADGCSVTGGMVYRGSVLEALQGQYFYADFCAGWVRSFRYVNGAATELRQWGFPDIGSITSFGVDGHGELYVLAAAGTVFRIAAIDTQ